MCVWQEHHDRNSCAPLGGFNVRVQRAAAHKHGDGQGHGNSRDGKADSPGDRVLDVDNHCAGDERADVDGEVEPVEEGALLFAVLRHGPCQSEPPVVPPGVVRA